MSEASSVTLLIRPFDVARDILIPRRSGSPCGSSRGDHTLTQIGTNVRLVGGVAELAVPQIGRAIFASSSLASRLVSPLTITRSAGVAMTVRAAVTCLRLSLFNDRIAQGSSRSFPSAFTSWGRVFGGF